MPPSETAAVRGWRPREGFLVEAGLSELGLRHGVTTRRLGNMKDPAKRAAAAALLGAGEPLVLKQVHGTVIHRGVPSAAGLEGDGWTLGPGDEGVCVGVYAADCLPLFLWADDGRRAGVFHAGWRGLAAGMPAKAVAAMAERGARAESLRAAFGPHIGAAAYRVGPELEASFPASSFSRRAEGLFLDMDAEARRQLLGAGLRPESIGPAAPCTASDEDAYFSYRRDKRDARMLAMISLGAGR